MKKFFTLLIALFTFCSAAFSSTSTVRLYAATATSVGGIATSTEHFTGTGAWKNDPASVTGKMELYLPLTSLGSFTINDISALSFTTKKVLPAGSNLDFYWTTYTSGTKYGWYQERLISEPMYYNGYNAPYNVWNTYQTTAGTNQMTFYDAHYGSQGWYNAATLADLKAGPINWALKGGTTTTNINYGSQTVALMSLSTGSGWNSVLLSYLDNIMITLNNGDVLTIDLEERDPTPVTTIQVPVETTCSNYDVPVTVQDFKNVGNISLKLSYDPLVFDYQGVTLNTVIGSSVADVYIPGQFILSYADGGQTLGDGAVLFTLHFKLLPTIPGSTSLTWETSECEYSSPGYPSLVYSSTFVDKTWTIDGRPVKNTRNNLEYCKIQAAIDDSRTHDYDIITVAAGNYDERITINKKLTLQGATAGINKNGYAIPSGYAYDPMVHSIIKPSSPLEQAVVVIKSDEVVFDGFVVANQVCQTGGVYQDLVELDQSTSCPVGIQILNNILGPNTNTASQDGTKGRSGLCIIGPNVNQVKLIAKNNKIFDSKGNGCGIMIVGPYGPTYHGTAYYNKYSGSVIENNEITGNHRSGIEFAGGVQGGSLPANYFIVKDNLITNNGWYNLSEKDNLKFGNGIMLIRAGSDRINCDANGSRYISFENNTIKGNEKTGIYIGPMNKDIFFTGNTIQNNGLGTGGYSLWDGVRVDLAESYYASGTCCTNYSYLTNTPFDNNNILGNGAMGMKVIQTPALGPVMAENNWWGDATGPKNLPDNTCGLGSEISANVDFIPWQTSDGSGSGTLAVKNVTKGTWYCKIQDAIDDSRTVAGDVITVAAGTYAENIVVNKSLTIQGPKANVGGCDLSRGTGEAIVVPATNAAEYGEIFHVTASNVSIKGFTIDGDNTLLTSGVTNSIGSDMNAAEGVTVYVDNVNNLTVENNIFQNLAYFGVTLFGGSYSAPATSNHSINNNKFQNLGTYNDPNPDPNYNINAWGGGVLLYNNQYAAVTNNCMTNVRLGIQTGNFSRANPGTTAYQVMDNNTIQSRRRGIFHNLHYSSTSPYTLSNNTLTALADSHETSYWDGILLASLSVPWTCTGNTINGAGMTIPTHGYQIWNVASTSTALISGGSVSNVNNGVFANNWEGYFNSNGGDGAHATLSNISISPLATGTGIRLHDHPSSTHGNVQITIDSDVIITGGTNGLVVEGSSAKLISPVGNLALNGQTSKYIQLIDNANDIDATAVKFDSQLGSGMSNATLFTTEDKIDHKIDLSSLGLVTVKALNDYVTVNSFVTPNITPAIQRGIVAAGSTGWTVNVGPGIFVEEGQVVIDKNLTVLGDDKTTTIIKPANDIPEASYKDDASAWFLVNPGKSFNLSKVTLDGTGKLVCNAILSHGSGLITDNIIKNIEHGQSTDYDGCGIALYGATMTVSNNTFSGIGREGVFSAFFSTSTITGNTYYGKGTGDWLDYAFEVGRNSSAIIHANTVSGNTGVATVDGSTSAGVLVTSYYDLSGAHTNATITNNFITGNTSGIAVGYDGSDASSVLANNNDLSGNADKAIISTAPVVNATCNWYGINTVSGVAAKISGPVTYDPWLVDGTDIGDPGFVPGGACTGATELFVNDGVFDGNDIYTHAIGNDANPGTADAPFLTIGKAVSVAVVGTTIKVDAGTFQEQVQVGKSLNIIGNDKSKTIVKAPVTMVPVPLSIWSPGENSNPVIYAYGNSNTVNISKLTIDGDNGRTVNRFFGALYFEANGTFDNNRITGIRDAGSFSGMQMGVAYYGGHLRTSTLAQNLTVTNNIIDDYQKGGIVVDAPGTYGDIENNQVTGQNVANVTAQNGIQLSRSAYGIMSHNTVTNNIWNKVEHPHADNAAGILLYQAGTSTVAGNSLTGNECGLSSSGSTGVTYDINNFANNKNHLWLDVAADVNPGNVYDKYVLNPAMPEVVFGCIQYSVDEASSGNILNASAGTFVENVIVHTPVTVNGSGETSTTVIPAFSNPNCGGAGGGSLCSGSSNIFLVQANNVTIQNLTADGNNPDPLITSGISKNGVDLDARNGIITDHTIPGVRNGLNVNHVAIKNIYLRGIYASTGGTFDLQNNTVTNVTGETQSIGIMNWAGTGLIKNNTLTLCNDAICSNHSSGVTYESNVVTHSNTGIHSDNNGDSGGRADIIKNNNVSLGNTNAYGIFIFAPYKDIQVLDNTVTNCAYGFASAGQYASVSPLVSGNTFDGGYLGAYLTTAVWGYAAGNQNITLTNNFIKNYSYAFYLVADAGKTNNTSVNNNSITSNGYGVATSGAGLITSNMTCNWWGATDAAAVTAAVGEVDPPVNHTPWLINGTDDQLSVPGFQPVSGSCHGSPIALTCAEDVTEASCQSQADINTAFTAWLGSVSASGCSGTLTTDPASPAAPSACGGHIEVTWNYTSDCGNLTCTKTFTVTDAPAVVIHCPADVTVNQTQEKDPFATGYATATNCSTPSVITYNDDRTTLNLCNATGYITRTWSVTNSCGSTATCQQRINVTDVTDPVLTACPSDITKNNDDGACSAVINYTAPTGTDFGYFQGFENTAWLSGNYVNNPSTDWNDYNSQITRVATGTDGIASKTGSAHAVINSTVLPVSPDDYSGAFCRLGGYNGTFGSGFISSVDVYFNMGDPGLASGTYGWDLDQAVSNNTSGFLRDFVYHVGGDNTGIYVCVSNNSSNSIPAMTPAYIQTQPHAFIPAGTPSGWYTMKWETRNNAGFLAVDFTITDASNNLIWTNTITGTDAIATVGGNRYMWFNFVAVEKLAIDNTTLTRKIGVVAVPPCGTTFAVGTTPVTVTTTDACGKTATCSFNVIVNDNVSPTLTCPGTITVQCIEPLPYVDFTAFTAAGGSASDNCSVDATSFAFVKDVKSNETCAHRYTITRTYKISDIHGNWGTCDQTILVNDITAPTGTPPAGGSGINACYIDAVTPPTGTPAFNAITAVAGYTDNCTGTLTASLTNTAVTGTNCNWTVTYTFKVSDVCGNELTGQTIQYTGGNTTPPSVPVDGAATVQCISAITTPTPPTVTACGVTLTPSGPVITDNPVSLTCEGTRTYAYTYTACPGVSSVWKFVYTIDHTTAPVVPANGAKTVSCPGDAMAPTSLSVVDQQQLSVNTGLLTPYWNNFTSIGQSITCGTSGWLTQIDLRVGTLVAPLDFTLQIYQGNGIAGTLLYSGNQSFSATGWQSLNIAQTVAPYLTAGQQYTFWLTSFTYNQVGLFFMYPNAYNGGVSMDGCTSGCSPTYVWQQWPDYDLTFKTYMSTLPLVNDVCGNNITPTLTSTVDVPSPLACEGTRTYTYKYQDCSGLFSNWSYTYTIDYSGGLTPPANAVSTVSCPAQAVNPGPPANITDACGRSVAPVLIGSTSSPNPVTCNGTVVWRYRYTDCDGTTTADWTKTYTITYSGGLTPPANVIATVSCPSQAINPGPPATIQDACGRTVVPVLVGSVSTPNPVTCNGTVVWTYKYTACDGTTANWTKTYNVIYSGSLTAPIAGLTTVSCPAASQVAPPTTDITDACGRTVSPVLVGHDPAPSCNADVVWHYTYTACDGTTIVPWTYTYHVVYSGGLTAPTAGATTVSCPAASQVAPPTTDITDACNRTVSPVLVGHDPAPSCNADVVWHYIYTACDNMTTATWTYTYHVLYAGGLMAPASGSSTVAGPAQAVDPGAPANITDACGRAVHAALVGHSTIPACEGTVVWTYRYTACDGTTTADWTYTYTVTRSTLSGNLKYNNPAKTPLNNVTLRLLDSGNNPVGSDITTDSGTGAYSFTNLCPDTYTITVVNNNKGVGGINSTDAGAANAWPTTNIWIEHTQFLAGDVTANNFVSAIDASLIQKYFVYGKYVVPATTPPTTWFTRSEWSYWKAGDLVKNNYNPAPAPPTTFAVAVSGNVTNYNLYGEATGDFNGSFTPGALKSASNTVQMTYGATLKIEASQDFELPIRVMNETDLGAVSLILEIPSDLVEVKDVYLKGSNEKPDFSVNGNLLTIGWNSSASVKLPAGVEMLVLKLKTTAKFTEGNSIKLTLAADPLNELADSYSNVIPDAILITDILVNGNVGIDEQDGNNGLTLVNYPNPFIESTTVHYTLPIDGDVTLEIYNMVGQVVKTLVNKPQTSGSYILKVDAHTLSQGIYTTILRLHNDTDDMVKTVKFVVNK